MFHCIYIFFSPEKLSVLSLLEGVKPSPDRNMIKVQTFDNLFPRVRHYDILSKTPSSRMTTVTSFSRQNDAGSPASTT